MAEHTDALAAAGPASLQIYQELVSALASIGAYQEEVKKTSIHLVHRSAFAGVRLRRQHLVLTMKTDKPIQSPRISKTEQVSKNRWHVEVKLAVADDIDDELLCWLREAYVLCA